MNSFNQDVDEKFEALKTILRQKNGLIPAGLQWGSGVSHVEVRIPRKVLKSGHGEFVPAPGVDRSSNGEFVLLRGSDPKPVGESAIALLEKFRL